MQISPDRPIRVELDAREAAMIKRRPDYLGHIAIAVFADGPRGARFRNIRTKACVNEIELQREIERLQEKRWSRTYIVRFARGFVDMHGNCEVA
jgi:3'-phosphoadenosine 5'-phosphosulfate sulfotransferase